MFYVVISPSFDVKSIIFPNFGQEPFPKIAGKGPELTCFSCDLNGNRSGLSCRRNGISILWLALFSRITLRWGDKNLTTGKFVLFIKESNNMDPDKAPDIAPGPPNGLPRVSHAFG